jgi:hypothetical protein
MMLPPWKMVMLPWPPKCATCGHRMHWHRPRDGQRMECGVSVVPPDPNKRLIACDCTRYVEPEETHADE